MRIIFLLAATAIFCFSCFEPNYKIEELYGKWESEKLGFTFNEDGSCEVIMNGNKWPGETKFRAVSIGNTLEFTSGGKVFLSNVTIKSLTGDILNIEMRDMLNPTKQATEIHVLNRAK